MNNKLFVSTELLNNICFNILKGETSDYLNLNTNIKKFLNMSIVSKVSNKFYFKYNNESIEALYKLNIYEDKDYYYLNRVLDSNHNKILTIIINKNIENFNYILNFEVDKESNKNIIHFKTIIF